MEERFFLDGVNVNRAGVAVDHRPQGAVDIDSDAAVAALTLFEDTGLRA